MRKTIPLSIVRMRMARAKELGMDYKTYAKVRQASGQDILALMFSSNALRIVGSGAKMPAAEDAALQSVRNAKKLSLVYPPNTPQSVLRENIPLDAADIAPYFTDSWSIMRQKVSRLIHEQRVPSGSVLVIGDAPLEHEWPVAAKAAGYLTSAEYFRPS
ncbi:hypothetical protein [Cognatishimia sp.]|uniref:hypothetical protein n=1 Tax=Cognatishimia sp. TaxID=2211648 RepID=UPI003BAC308F